MKAVKEYTESDKQTPAPKSKKKSALERGLEDIAKGRVIRVEMGTKEALEAFGLTKVPDRSKYFPNDKAHKSE